MTTVRFAFPAETCMFLADLRANNSKAWFDANRDRYQAAYVAPAQALVEAIAPALDDLRPGIAAEPRVNGSIFRINRDLRFSKDKTPYKDHLDFWFWEGERRTAVSGLFLRVAPDHVIVGAGAQGFASHQLAAYRKAVADPIRGEDLLATIADVEGSGHAIGGEVLTRIPRGYRAAGERARLLRHKALHATAELPPDTATNSKLIPTLVQHWRALVPLHCWLVANVDDGAIRHLRITVVPPQEQGDAIPLSE